MSWFESVALCYGCWDAQAPGMRSTRSHEGPLERCHRCGKQTLSGIYDRVDTEAKEAAEPRDAAVTQLRVQSLGGHEVVQIWVDGKAVGILKMGEGDGASMVGLLSREKP